MAAVQPVDSHGGSMITMDTDTANLTMSTDDRRDVTIYNDGGRRHPFQIQVFPSNDEGLLSASLITENSINDEVQTVLNRRSSQTFVLSVRAAQCITTCRESVTLRVENLDTGATAEETFDVRIERENQQVVSSALEPTQIVVLIFGVAVVFGLRREPS